MLHRISRYFFSDYHFKIQTSWFKRLLYLFLVGELAYYLAYFDVLFGTNSIVVADPKSIGFFKNLAFILYDSGSPALNLCFILAVAGLSLLNLITKRFALIADGLLWLLMINIHNRIYPALTGGNNLLNQLLFFNCFLSGSFSIKDHWSSQVKICLHNIGISGILIQVCLLYFLSALAKLADPQWLSGQAITQITQIARFSLFSFSDHLVHLHAALVFLNYAVLFYQLLFPFLIWIKKIKKPLLIFGVLMHLYIALFMGLMSFGFVMILSYAFFWPLKQAKS